MNWNNKSVLVTGANRGIGRAFVYELLERGTGRIYAAARDVTKLAEFAPHESVRALAIDVTRPETLVEVAEEVASLDLLINNAGSLRSFSMLAATRDELAADLAVNYYGLIDTTRALLPHLEATKGAVMNVLSVVSLSSMAGVGGYSASKAAAWSAKESRRAELKDKVDVYAVFPGPVDTDMVRDFEMDKTAPEAIAKAAISAYGVRNLDCFPDPMSQQVHDAWMNNPRSLEQMFSNI